MNVEWKYGSKINYGKVWCESCAKVLKVEEAPNNGMEELLDAQIEYLEALAMLHIRRHPKHADKVNVLLYQRTPTKTDLGN